MRATHIATWYGGHRERVAIIEDKSYRAPAESLYQGRLGSVLVWSEKTDGQRWIGFGIYNLVSLESIVEPASKYLPGDRLYFHPSLERMPHGTTIPAGMVEVIDVVDHGYDPIRERWTYVVKSVNTGQKQGAAEKELYVREES